MSDKPTIRLRSVVIALGCFLVLIGGLEVAARSMPMTVYIASRPADISSVRAHTARLEAFAALRGEKIVVVGDSVALGKIMFDHGIKDWQTRGLSTDLADILRQSRPDISVANFAGNGLRPADVAELMRECAQAGATAIVFVASLRGFSAEFEAENERYTYPWLAELAKANPIGPDADPKGFVDGSLAATWRSRGVLDFLVTDWLGGPLRSALTQIREMMKAEKRISAGNEAVQVLRMKQRLGNAKVEPSDRFQARELLDALRFLGSRGVPVIAVYATENPAVLPRLMLPATAQRNRAALESLVLASGEMHKYLGPDPAMKEEFYFDQMHPTPQGYRIMAERLAPALLGLLSGR